MQLESNLAREQETQVNKLLKRIDKLEKDTQNKQCSLEQVKIIVFVKDSSNYSFLFSRCCLYFSCAAKKLSLKTHWNRSKSRWWTGCGERWRNWKPRRGKITSIFRRIIIRCKIKKYFNVCFRLLQEKLEQPISEPPSPRDLDREGDMAGNLTENIQSLKAEVSKLKNQLMTVERESKSQFTYPLSED